MKHIFIFTLMLAFIACDSKLTEEQRKALKDEMIERKIRKISQDEIYKKALEEGRSLMKAILAGQNKERLSADCDCQILLVNKISDELTAKEKQVVEAYLFSSGEDNIQKDGDDKLIYTQPITTDSTKAVWVIRFKKSTIVKKL